MVQRNLVRIDEEKCTGCGLCIIACAEGALKIVDGKARLISDIYCDGLGACLGECPEEAITVEEQEAAEFDEAAVEKHLKMEQPVPAAHGEHSIHHSCPSAQVIQFPENPEEKEAVKISDRKPSMLSQWPVQLKLLPPNAPVFEDADLLVAADCVPFASANFHDDFLRGRTIVVGCPKLDDSRFYMERLTEILKQSNVRSVTVVNMEVPCCFGLYRLVKEALGSSGKTVPLKQHIISVKGDEISPPHFQ